MNGTVADGYNGNFKEKTGPFLTGFACWKGLSNEEMYYITRMKETDIRSSDLDNYKKWKVFDWKHRPLRTLLSMSYYCYMK